MTPLLALRAACRAFCLADPALAGLMGGTIRILDEPGRGATPLYAVFGPSTCRDVSASGGRVHETEFSLVIWAEPGSAASAIAAADRIGTLLDDAPLALDGHRLAGLALARLETARDPETHLARVTLEFRAVTEPAP